MTPEGLQPPRHEHVLSTTHRNSHRALGGRGSDHPISQLRKLRFPHPGGKMVSIMHRGGVTAETVSDCYVIAGDCKEALSRTFLVLVRLQKLESGILRPGGDKLGSGGDWVEMRGWFCGLWRGNGAPTSGNIESVASSWASSAASVLHRPSSQTCNT